MAAGVLFPQSKAAAPRVAGGAVNGTRVFVIGIFAAAFFSRVLC